MFNINKIRAHIKALDFQELKLSRYLKEQQAMTVPDGKRIQDIERSLKRVTDKRDYWQAKISAIESQPPRAPDRGSVLDSDPNRPLIG